MMKFELYDNAEKYADDVMDYLAAHEIQGNMIMGICLGAKSGADASKWFMGTVRDREGELKLAAVMTPPHNLVLYESYAAEDEAVGLLAKELGAMRVPIPGVLAENSLARRFAESYSTVTGRGVRLAKNLRIYRLDNVNAIPMAPGSLRPAKQEEMFYLPYWHMGFSIDCGFGVPEASSAVEKVKKQVADKLLYVWEDGVPVSQAAIARKTVNGAVIGAVYTPPHYRGKGYASACVSSLSRLALEMGNKFCCLFTDLSNPISNSIYMKMGYVPVCNNDEYQFTQLPE